MVALVMERGRGYRTSVLGHASDTRPWYEILDEINELEAGISWSGSQWLRHESFWARTHTRSGSVKRRIRVPRKTEWDTARESIRFSLWNDEWEPLAPKNPDRIASLIRESASNGRIMIRPLEDTPPEGAVFLQFDHWKTPLRDIEVLLWKMAS